MCLAIHSPRVATPSRLTKGKLGEGVPFFGHVETQTMQTADGADYADCADYMQTECYFFTCSVIF